MNTMNPPQQQQPYSFSSPYPQPQYNYPTAHSRTSIVSGSDNSTHPIRPGSPTPSELEEVNRPFISKKYYSAEFYKRPKVILYILLTVLILVLVALFSIFHKQIEHKLQPAANWAKNLKAGWLIPIAILFIVSFPPLFGHEIIAVLCGNVWGLWIGFAIVAAGTLLGEIGNFYAFRYICQARATKAERDSWWYACLAKTVREGGFKIAVIARLSAIPGHFTTAIFATCGMNIIVFTLAAILSLPKQFFTVYVGVLLEESANGSKPTTKQNLISDGIFVATFAITVAAGWYILKKTKEQRLAVVRERRARQRDEGAMKMEYSETESRLPLTRVANDSSTSLNSTDVFNPRPSEIDLPTTAYGGFNSNVGRPSFEPSYPAQQWDSRGNAVDYSQPPPSRPVTSERPMSTGRGGGAYEDPYAYNAYPPQKAPSPIPPVIPGPPSSAPVAHAPSSAGFPDPHATPTQDQFISTPPRMKLPEEPQSPFDDVHAIPFSKPVTQPQIPAHVPRFQLTDGSPSHTQEPTDASFYSAHSAQGSEDTLR